MTIYFGRFDSEISDLKKPILPLIIFASIHLDDNTGSTGTALNRESRKNSEINDGHTLRCSTRDSGGLSLNIMPKERNRRKSSEVEKVDIEEYGNNTVVLDPKGK